MKNYKILESTNVDTLAEYVEAAINDGWDLSGFVFTTKGGKMVNQAIIKITAGRPVTWADCQAPGCNEPTERGTLWCLEHQDD